MAENNEEINVINHLLNVEKNAAVLIDNALKEAENRTSQARNQSNTQFKEKYDSFVADMEAEYNKTVQLKKDEHEKELQSFKDNLQNQKINNSEFNKVLDGLLFSSK